MRITAITQQKKTKDRFNIFIDGKFAFALDGELVIKYHLRVDLEISSEFITTLIKENELVYWYNRALNMISFRPRSKKEITDFLKKKEIGEQTMQLVTDKLETLNLINDLEFSKWFIEQRQLFRPKGTRLLVYELKQKGVDSEIIQEVLTEKPQDEFEAASQLIEKKMRLWQKLPVLSQKKKITNFLGNRGYNWETISKIWDLFMKNPPI